MSLKLYVFPPSPRAFKVLAVANHLELAYEVELVDFARGQHKDPSYTTLNPNQRMPTLVDGDYVLWESNAIAQYLAGRRPEAGLLPGGERERLDVTRWQFWDLAHWDPACAIFMFENVVKPMFMPGVPSDAGALAKGAELFHSAARVLDGHLAGRRYVAGNALSVADFSLGAVLNYAGPAQLPLAGYDQIKRWHAGLTTLPSWQRTLAQSRPLA